MGTGALSPFVDRAARLAILVAVLVDVAIFLLRVVLAGAQVRKRLGRHVLLALAVAGADIAGVARVVGLAGEAAVCLDAAELVAAILGRHVAIVTLFAVGPYGGRAGALEEKRIGKLDPRDAGIRGELDAILARVVRLDPCGGVTSKDLAHQIRNVLTSGAGDCFIGKHLLRPDEKVLGRQRACRIRQEAPSKALNLRQDSVKCIRFLNKGSSLSIPSEIIGGQCPIVHGCFSEIKSRRRLQAGIYNGVLVCNPDPLALETSPARDISPFRCWNCVDNRTQTFPSAKSGKIICWTRQDAVLAVARLLSVRVLPNTCHHNGS